MPTLLKPDAAELLLLLWVLHDGEAHGITPDSMPERPSQGLTSVAIDKSVPVAFWHAAGFHVAGARAVRIDMLERLSDMIRQRVSWRPPTEQAGIEPVKPDTEAQAEDETNEPAVMAEAQPSDGAPAAILEAEAPAETSAAAQTETAADIPNQTAQTDGQAAPGDDKQDKPQPALSRMRSDALAKRAGISKKKKQAPSNEPPSGATGDGGFRVVPELMSVVGCSGEDFTSILKALGFRCQRTPLPPAPEETKPEAPAPAADAAQGSDPSPVAAEKTEAKASVEPEERFDEVWRPSRRAQNRPQERGARRGGGAPKQEGQRKRNRPPQNRNNGKPNRPPRERREKAPDPAHSPFAALEQLKRNMMSRGSEGN
ncbi:hypothetical protein A7A08_03076 [Methyloligella halotolerans]|uniref:Uncharacterized protein n=1 Tax=Methyloligella halotolerans TaxID=1177755 RepID=A0A1E2RV27_9HYPH|nr:hypothetical protein A7A08_03076 [Methyloligella halotolerans]